MTGRIYDKRLWRRLRKMKLDVNPLCESCAERGLTVIATDVDHIVEIRDGGEPFPPLNELMSMCHACHSIKTMGGVPMTKGYDKDGYPIDPTHPFVQP